MAFSLPQSVNSYPACSRNCSSTAEIKDWEVIRPAHVKCYKSSNFNNSQEKHGVLREELVKLAVNDPSMNVKQ